jgi:hypothetical protein
MELTLKNVRKTYESLKATRMKARKVERPPLKTAGPMAANTWLARSFLLPVKYVPFGTAPKIIYLR